VGIHELGTGKTQGVVNQAKVGSKIALLCGYVGTSKVIDYNASMVYRAHMHMHLCGDGDGIVRPPPMHAERAPSSHLPARM
jgi:hypothetical protein